MPNYLLDKIKTLKLYRDSYKELQESTEWEDNEYKELQESTEWEDNEREGLVYLFKEWLELISPADFGYEEGLGGVLV